MHETQEIQVQSLGWEDPQEEGMAIHSSILAGTMDRGAGQAMVYGVIKSQTRLTWPSMYKRVITHGFVGQVYIKHYLLF